MKKRLLPQKYIKDAYSKDLVQIDRETSPVKKEEEVLRLPGEMIEILGEFISFIENTNKLEGDINNEN